MRAAEQKVVRGAVLRHLRSAYGISLKKRISEKLESSTTAACSQKKVFGVPLEQLQMRNLADYGLVPCFLVDSCKHLLNHAGSEGLFRKCGSVVRLKALRARLDKGEDCLSTALPCDVASLVKQFFYELPCPALPAVLVPSFKRAQGLATEEERRAATQLLSCLLPEITLSTLRFFFIFLKQVSLRASENKMDSYNLSVVFTPNLFCLHQTPEWNNGCHRLHIAIICTLIENAYTFGVVPDNIMANGPTMVDTPLPSAFEWKRKGRSCSEVLLLSTTETPNSVAKILTDGAGGEFPRRKRKSFRRSLGMVPSVLFGCCYDSSSTKQDSSPSAVLNRRLSKSSRRRSCASVCKSVKRVVSDTFGCVASSPGEKTPPKSPVASCWLQPYQDTPVGLCLKKQHPEWESVPNKPPAISAFRTLFCPSATDSPEDQQFLTQDELTSSLCHLKSAATSLENGMSALRKDSRTTSNLEEPSTPVDAEQIQVNGEKEFPPQEKCSYPKLLGKLTSQLDLLPPPSSSLLESDADSGFQETCGALKGLSGCKPLKTPSTPRISRVSVVDRVRKYDKLNLRPAMSKVIQSPLKFQRTPVFQCVKRINSCMKRQIIKSSANHQICKS